MKPHRISYLLSLFVVSSLLGCAENNDLKTEPVSGVVTLDGQPVEGATVTFRPSEKGVGIGATAITDAQGVYKLTATQIVNDKQPVQGAGTLPGKYQVTVKKVEVPEVMSAEEAEEQGVPYNPPAPGQEPQPTWIIPKKFSSARSSGIEVTVVEGQNDIPLELTSK